MRSHTHSKYSTRNWIMNRKKIFLFFHLLSVAWSSQVTSRVYNKIYSVNLQGVLVFLDVNRIVDLQRSKHSLEVGYSYQYSPGWKQGLQRRLFCRPPRWINLTLKLYVDLQGVLVSESSWTSSRLIPTQEESMVSCATTCVNKGRVHKKSGKVWCFTIPQRVQGRFGKLPYHTGYCLFLVV